MTQVPLATPSTLAGVIRAIKDIKQILLGRVTFVENISANITTVHSLVPVATDIVIDHTLDRVPTGFFSFGLNVAPIIYASSTPWTKTQIFLKSNLSPVDFQVIIF